MHLFIFLFAIDGMIISGPGTAEILSLIRRVVVIVGVVYGIAFWTIFPRHLRIVTISYILLTLLLIGVSYNKYGIALGSLQYMSLSLTFTVVYGGFISAWFLKDANIKLIINMVWVVFIINQLLLGRIFMHHFNSVDRSTNVDETYFLNLLFCYYLVNFLKEGKSKYMNMAIFTFGLIILLFHRTVWITTIFSIVVIIFIMRREVSTKLTHMLLLAVPYILIMVIGVTLLIAVKPDIITSVDDSLDEIQNSNTKGTAGWRSNQRELYWKRIVERPFFGWNYDGYDDGELTAEEEGNENWVGVKSTFIHSGYIHVLYHYGLFGLFIVYGLVLNTLVFMWRRWRYDADYIALFAFLSTGFVFSWSYQLSLSYWVLLGIGCYIACLVPTQGVVARDLNSHVDHFSPEILA